MSQPDGTYVRSLLQNPPSREPQSISQTIKCLNLQPHPEGGYYAETDRSANLIPSPYLHSPPLPNATTTITTSSLSPTRHASTSIFYLLSLLSPAGHFHRNRSRTIHTLHRGRGRYVIIHADQSPATVESFVVGHDLGAGEKLQWIVEGGKFKASYLLPDPGSDSSDAGLLISETVVPGFEFVDHDFLTADGLRQMVKPEEEASELGWLLKADEREKLKHEGNLD